MSNINWKVTPEDDALINEIVERACVLYEAAVGAELDRLSTMMDIKACHLNGTPLRLQELLDASEFDFAHDITGIIRHMDRNTGKLSNHFLPRYAA